jgi:class 3 adenylate cyclase/tetratricopeptide (TPR) repeat protein
MCGNMHPADSIFCDKCGHNLIAAPAEKHDLHKISPPLSISDSERKYVTVLFSDMSGYTAMTEKLDPEEVKEIMDRIFGKISQVVVKYEGFIEKFVGDAVMAIFGVPKTHEDDPIRAILAAREIHALVKEISPTLTKTIGRTLYMHTGINTGLVVAKEIDFDKGTHGVLGDTINIASRISGLAKPDEIIVGADTYQHTEGYFEFKKKKSVKVKGKEEPIQIYKVLSPKETLSKTHRLSGLRSELIGRRVEMDQLKEAVDNLKQGKSSSFSIIGDAGTGKSRLVEEFRNSLDLNTIQWREGHSYGYSQNIPYFPVIDLLSRAWQIKEGDPPDQTRQKVEKGAQATLGERKDLIPYIGSLYSLPYPEIETVPPEQWKAKLHEAINLILANLCKRMPTIICIEDLHWADPSSVELLRNILTDLKYPVIFLCIYRSSFNLFTSHQAGSMKSYHEIRLLHLSPTDAQSMVESLLKTKTIPKQLQMFVRDKAEGNPFYLEEVINSLIETDTLIKDKDSWKLSRALTEKDIPSTVQGVISARLDRLERETKRILQEASVIGRAFLYEILRRISDLKEYIDKSLINLERLDLIKTISLQPELEYIFKHALTQEVVYNGLLMKERRLIHEKIGLVMEELLQEHLPEFYETLAYHYSQSDNFQKACEYLKLAGDKASKSYANQEAIKFYEEALRILRNQPETETIKRQKIELCLSLFYRMFLMNSPEENILEILHDAERLSQEIEDTQVLATVYGKLSFYHTSRGNPSLSLDYAEKSFNVAEKSGAVDIMMPIAFDTCFTHNLYGNFVKVIDIAPRALRALEEHHKEKDVFSGGINVYAMLSAYYGVALAWSGDFADAKTVFDKGFYIAHEVNDLLQIGALNMMSSFSSYFEGENETAIDYGQKAIKYYDEAGAMFAMDVACSVLGGGHYLRGEYEIARDYAEKGLSLAKETGSLATMPWSYWFLAMGQYALKDLYNSSISAGEALKLSKEFNIKPVEGLAWMLLGRIKEGIDPSHFDDAQQHILHGISIFEELKTTAVSALAHLFLGEIYADAGRKEEAFNNLKKSETMYLDMKVTPQSYWLTRTKDALKKLGSAAGAAR